MADEEKQEGEVSEVHAGMLALQAGLKDFEQEARKYINILASYKSIVKDPDFLRIIEENLNRAKEAKLVDVIPEPTPPQPPETPPEPTPPETGLVGIEKAELDAATKFKQMLDAGVKKYIASYIKENKKMISDFESKGRNMMDYLKGGVATTKLLLWGKPLVDLINSMESYSKRLLYYCSNLKSLIEENFLRLSNKLLAQEITPQQKEKISVNLEKIMKDVDLLNNLITELMQLEPKIGNVYNQFKGNILAIADENINPRGETGKNVASAASNMEELIKLKKSEQEALKNFVNIYKRISPNLNDLINLLEMFISKPKS